MEQVWREELKNVQIPDPSTTKNYKEIYKGPCEEIKELDDEYLYTSGLQSNENTERIIPNGAARANTPDELVEYRFRSTPDAMGRQPTESVIVGHWHDEHGSHSVPLNESPPKRIVEETRPYAAVEELLFYPRSVHSENKDRMNKSERVASLTDLSHLHKPLFGPRFLYSKFISDSRRGGRSPVNVRERKADETVFQSRHFRSNERQDGIKKPTSQQDIEPLIRGYPCSRNSPSLLHKSSKSSFKVLKANATFSGEISKMLSHHSTNYSGHFHTQSSNRASNGRAAKDTLFHDILKKTTQIVASPFLKARKTGEGSLKDGLSAEKSRRDEHKSTTPKTHDDSKRQNLN